MARDILKTLQAEHDTVRALFEEINDTTDRAKKKRLGLLEEIEGALLPHAKWEELVFYPAFKERADREGLQMHAEAVQEHRAVELQVMPDVHAAEADTPEFAGRVKVFGELIDHHATEEEDAMFKMARKLFDAKERAQLDVDYEEWKQSTAATAAVEGAKGKAGAKGVVRALMGA